MNVSKKEFIDKLKEAIKLDERSCVKDITYERAREKEIITITYTGGAEVRINVACNSHGANLLEIAREVYGNGAFGRMCDE